MKVRASGAATCRSNVEREADTGRERGGPTEGGEEEGGIAWGLDRPLDEEKKMKLRGRWIAMRAQLFVKTMRNLQL